jgi:transcriptional regulator with XRE-family HTH domain
MEQLARAQLMRQSLADAKLRQKDVAKAMKRSEGTITRWLQGKQRPSDSDLAHFAAIVGRPVVYFAGGPSEDVTAQVIQVLRQLGRQAMNGLSMPEAMLAAKVPPEQLTAELVKEMQPVADDFRSRIRRLAGQEWHLLSEADREAVLDQFAQILIGGKNPPAEGRRGGSRTAAGPRTPPLPQ